MNLYRIVLTHYAPKDSEDATACFLIAKDDEEVYEAIKERFKAYGDDFIVYWDSEIEREVYDGDYNVVRTETLKEYYISIRGQAFDEDYEPEDLYYGATTFGWELFKEALSENDISVLLNTGVAIKFNN